MKRFSLILITLLLVFTLTLPHYGAGHFTLGTEEGPGELILTDQVKEGPDGNIYAYAESEGTIKVYSPQGKYLRRIGRKGEGPGDIKRTRDFFFDFSADKKHLLFAEFFGGHRWITFMNLDGRLHKTLKLQVGVNSYGVNSLHSLPGGLFLIHFALTAEPVKKEDYFLQKFPQAIYLVDKEGKKISKIKRVDYFNRISFVEEGGDMGLPFIPGFAWCPYGKDTILFSDGLKKSFDIYDYQGKLAGTLPNDLPAPQKVTKKDLDKWRADYKEMFSHRKSDIEWYKRMGRVIEKYDKPIYEYKPNLVFITPTPNNNLMVYSRDQEEGDRYEYRLLDMNGKTLTTLKSSAWRVTISEHFIFFRLKDEDENIEVNVLARKGTEQEDLLSLKKIMEGK